ncbi:hypothetical protein [Thioclava sp. GXIMD4216]|uniref:hypothetical protein n=1 Tax=Thioclava sp. GXIMD4216 TaxID=3131929 RepID=UPI0030D56FC6
MSETLIELAHANRPYFDAHFTYRLDADRIIYRENIYRWRMAYAHGGYPDDIVEISQSILDTDRVGIDLLLACLQVPSFSDVFLCPSELARGRVTEVPKRKAIVAIYAQRIRTVLEEEPRRSLPDMLCQVFGWKRIKQPSPYLWQRGEGRDFLNQFMARFPERGTEILALFAAQFEAGRSGTGISYLRFRAELAGLLAWCERIDLNRMNWPAQWVMAQWTPAFSAFDLKCDIGSPEAEEAADLWFAMGERIGFAPAADMFRFVQAHRPWLFFTDSMCSDGHPKLKMGAAPEYMQTLRRAELAFCLEDDISKELYRAEWAVTQPSGLDLQALRASTRNSLPSRFLECVMAIVFGVLFCAALYGIVAAIAKAVVAAAGA